MKKKLTFVLAMVLLSMFASLASADITGWVGRLESDDLFIDGTTTFGGAVGFSFAKYFAFEVVVDYVRNSELPFNLEELEDAFGIDVTTDMLFISGNAVIQYPMDTITPFFTMGYGGFGMSVSNDLFDDVEALSGSMCFNFGFGAKVEFVPGFAIRGEWRTYRLSFDDEIVNVLTQVENPEFSRLAIGAAVTF